MSSSQFPRRRAHSLLLISKLLNLRDHVSPFNLVIDSLEQSSAPLIGEFILRANITQTTVIYVSFETLRKPTGVDSFIHAIRTELPFLHKQITAKVNSSSRTLVIIDSLSTLVSESSSQLPSFLSSLILPNCSLLAVYHNNLQFSTSHVNSYVPHALTILRYLATTIFTIHSLTHVLARKSARDRSLVEPTFGLLEEREGAVIGIGSNDSRGIVLEMEYRRKSGRGVRERFFLYPNTLARGVKLGTVQARKDAVTLLEDHPNYYNMSNPGWGEETSRDGEMDTTFNLTLTEKQRKDRDGVVLPYYDAQSEGGVGDGGRILYEMGEEDDFDEEEDEI